MRRYSVPMIVLVFAAATPGMAQADDAAYCAALSGLANRYIVSGTGEGRGVPDLETRAAIYDCDKGNTAAGIPVLERKLKANGFTLPKRS